jgi:hypothetical protein
MASYWILHMLDAILKTDKLDIDSISSFNTMGLDILYGMLREPKLFLALARIYQRFTTNERRTSELLSKLQAEQYTHRDIQLTLVCLRQACFVFELGLPLDPSPYPDLAPPLLRGYCDLDIGTIDNGAINLAVKFAQFCDTVHRAFKHLPGLNIHIDKIAIQPSSIDEAVNWTRENSLLTYHKALSRH